jgi:hypothetical protein
VLGDVVGDVGELLLELRVAHHAQLVRGQIVLHTPSVSPLPPQYETRRQMHTKSLERSLTKECFARF